MLNRIENAIYTGIKMKWRPLEADGSRTENAIYNVIAARWRPVEADGGCTENAICNIIAARWRPVEADGGQVEAAQDMQITIVRTRTEASGDSKLYNTIIGVTSLRPHQHHPSTFHS